MEQQLNVAVTEALKQEWLTYQVAQCYLMLGFVAACLICFYVCWQRANKTQLDFNKEPYEIGMLLSAILAILTLLFTLSAAISLLTPELSTLAHLLGRS